MAQIHKPDARGLRRVSLGGVHIGFVDMRGDKHDAVDVNGDILSASLPLNLAVKALVTAHRQKAGA